MLAQRILARRKGAELRRARAEHLVSHFVDRCGGVEAVYTASELLDAGEMSAGSASNDAPSAAIAFRASSPFGVCLVIS